MKPARLPVLTLALNTAGLVVYLVWLMRQDPHLLYAQDGIVYFLPLVPFAFVYLRAWMPGAGGAVEKDDA